MAEKQTITNVFNSQTEQRPSYAAAAARSATSAESANRDGPSMHTAALSKTYAYNPNGVILDRSELESLAFSHMVALRLLDSFIRNNYAAAAERDFVLDSLNRSFAKVDDVLNRHEIALQETNLHIIENLREVSLGLVQNDDNMSTMTGSTAVAVGQTDISGIQRLLSHTSTPCETRGPGVSSQGEAVVSASAPVAAPRAVSFAAQPTVQSMVTSAAAAVAPLPQPQQSELGVVYNSNAAQQQFYQQCWPQMPMTPMMQPYYEVPTPFTRMPAPVQQPTWNIPGNI